MEASKATMKVMVVGNGDREHAIISKLARSSLVQEVIAVPGNPGTAKMPKVSNLSSASLHVQELALLARRNSVHLIIPVAEEVIAQGMADAAAEIGIPCFAPSRLASQIGLSRNYALQLAAAHGIPMPDHILVHNLDEARQHIQSGVCGNGRLVIKNAVSNTKNDDDDTGDVLIPATRQEALEELTAIFEQDKLGAITGGIVLQEFVEGCHASVTTFCDGALDGRHVSLPPAFVDRDVEGGPIGKGLGAHAPTTYVSDEYVQRIGADIVAPTLRALAGEGRPYRGILVTNVVLGARGPVAVGFNTGWGHPETACILGLLAEETDVAAVCLAACVPGGLLLRTIPLQQGYACAVVVVAVVDAGAGGDRAGHQPLSLPRQEDGVQFFHAGTTAVDVAGGTTTKGRRVLTVVAVREAIPDAVFAALHGTLGVTSRGVQIPVYGQHGPW